MGESTQLPTSPDQITPEMLTRALRKGGAIRESAVTSFDTQIIGEGAGFLGQLAKLTLRYDRPEEGAPLSLIAKLPAAFPENKEVASFFRFYEREVRFYEEIAGQVELRTPRCYFSHFDPASGDYVLLLEDLAPAQVGDQMAGCTIAKAELALRELARFHATWWEHPTLENLDWMPSIDADWYVASVVQGYGEALPAFLGHLGDRLSDEDRTVVEKFAQRIPQVMGQFAERPWTIMHGDYRLDNIFFATDGGGPELAVIDWQIAARARGVFDVAYFVAGTLTPDERRANEQKLLRMYYDTLVDGGVRDYDYDDCFTEYRRSMLMLLNYSVIGIGSLDLANERGVELFDKICTGTLTAIRDLESAELLPP
jgi:aminoglycoside/choline kinase family phosphotransferase